MGLLWLVQRPMHQVLDRVRPRPVPRVQVGHGRRDLVDVLLRSLPRNCVTHLLEPDLADEGLRALDYHEYLDELAAEQVLRCRVVVVPDVDNLETVDDLLEARAQHRRVHEDEAAARQVRHVPKTESALGGRVPHEGLRCSPLLGLHARVHREVRLLCRPRMVPLRAHGPAPHELLAAACTFRTHRCKERRLSTLGDLEELLEVGLHLADRVRLATLVPPDRVVEQVAASEQAPRVQRTERHDPLALQLALPRRIAELLDGSLQRIHEFAQRLFQMIVAGHSVASRRDGGVDHADGMSDGLDAPRRPVLVAKEPLPSGGRAETDRAPGRGLVPPRGPTLRARRVRKLGGLEGHALLHLAPHRLELLRGRLARLERGDLNGLHLLLLPARRQLLPTLLAEAALLVQLADPGHFPWGECLAAFSHHVLRQNLALDLALFHRVTLQALAPLFGVVIQLLVPLARPRAAR
mmetsp:Transcript_93782/g.270982  ORF Transcript_93782/g.270982 Transcript_93782/m.270982 type:complete len:466 (-) Transcript_93782:1338-2735(-)